MKVALWFLLLVLTPEGQQQAEKTFNECQAFAKMSTSITCQRPPAEQLLWFTEKPNVSLQDPRFKVYVGKIDAKAIEVKPEQPKSETKKTKKP